MLRPPPRPTLFPYTTLFRSLTATASTIVAKPNGQDPIALDPLADGSFYDADHDIRIRFQLPWEGPLPEFTLIQGQDRKSTRLNSSHSQISYAVFCLKKKKNT